MRLSPIIVLSLLGSRLPSGVCGVGGSDIQQRQDTAETNFPTLTTDATSASTDEPSLESITSATPTSTRDGQTLSSEPSATADKSSASPPSSTARETSRTSSTVPTSSGAAAAASTAASTSKDEDELPLQPRITPTFGIAGVILIVLGAIYALIGVKSRWVQIFLSCAFLASIATTALVDYVIDPPITDAVQGGLFVAIFMTGAVFGGGALVFKEFTEGFGCLLGGFCFSMWLLTLKPGGLITSSGGKGAFIGIFCIVVWALSWSRYTRPYGLIGSTSFSGATAFTLGIDCFTRAGMKEFWFYIWDLNDDLFPLNTNTFPLTKGIRVEIAVIVIGTIIGVLSQIKLWKMIRSKQQEAEVITEEDERQKEAVEAALGRHLQRQNEREKSEWERQYGDRLQSKRNTVMWQNAHPEKRYSTVSVVAIQPTPSNSSESLEMNAFGPKRPSGYGPKNKRQSSATVDVIEEVEEDPEAAANERQKALNALEEGKSSSEGKRSGESSGAVSTHSALNESGSERNSSGPQAGRTRESLKPNRRSQQSLSRTSKTLSANLVGGSESQEHLIDVERPYSRASSAAATMDEDNEDLDVDTLDADSDPNILSPPEIVISPATANEGALPATSHETGEGVLKRQGSPASSIAGNSEDQSLLLDPDQQSSNGNAPIAEGVVAPAGSEAKEKAGDDRKAHSQASEATNSSVDSLTQTALAQVPSQLSNVVLSYRTNEWAKHITKAEIPIYDEPETIEGVDDEFPTQLAAPAPVSEKETRAKESAVEMPPPEILPSIVKAGGAGVGIASNPVATQRRSFSDQERRRSVVKAPSRSTSMQSLKLPSNRGSRYTFNPVSTTSLVTTPIDENVPTDFTHPKRTGRRSSAGSPYMVPQRASTASLPSNSGQRPATSHGSASPYGGSVYDLPQGTRPSSQHTDGPGLALGTRMESYDSHQPPRRDLTTETERRESLLADWRQSQRHRAARSGLNGVAAAETGRAQMKAEKDHQRLMEEYQRNAQQQKQFAMDQVMRSPEMQDLHREAMRKLQANANKKLRTSTA